MWGDGDFQKDVDKVKYRRKVREAAEMQYQVDKVMAFLLLVGGDWRC